MKKLIAIAVFTIIAVAFVVGQGYCGDNLVQYDWGLYFGAHYTGSADYYQKAGEYYRTNFVTKPEFGLNYIGTRNDKILKVKAIYYDDKRIKFNADAVGGDIWSAHLGYRSFYHQLGHDLLENMTVREVVDTSNTPGGKMITHKDLNPGAEYGFARHEISSDVSAKILNKDNFAVRLYAAHKSFIEKGEHQIIASMHCSSCHLQSETADIDLYSHNIKGGIEGKVGKSTIAYEFGYRETESRAGETDILYDVAQHPVTGGAIDEFESRMLFDGESVPYGKISKTDKYSQTIKGHTELPFGDLAGSFTHSKAENKDVGIAAKSNGGVLKFYSNLSKTLRFIGKSSLNRIRNDPYFVDLPPWREGRTGGGQDFDYTRYSNLTRTVFKGSGDFIYRPSLRYRIALSAGYQSDKRDDYPSYNQEYNTQTIFAEANFHYKPSSRFSSRLKLHIEKINNPFMAVGGLLEKRMNGVASPLPDNSLVYYFQRDDYRYGDITKLPALSQLADISIRYIPSNKLSLVAGVKVSFDKNNDMGTIDFERTALEPNLSATLALNPKWSFYASATQMYEKLNGPLAVALMDG